MAYNLTTLRGTPSFAGAGKFGTGSLSGGVINHPTADAFLSATGANGGALTTGTIEGWVKCAHDGAYRVAFGHNTWFWVGKDDAGKVQGRYGAGGGEIRLQAANYIADGAWHHIALVLSGGAGSLYLDGARVATSTTATTVGAPAAGIGFAVGGFGGGSDGTDGFDWTGSVDEVRLSNTARYTGATYTVPTAPFDDVDPATRALYHLDGNGTDTATSGPPPGDPSDTGILYSPYNWNVSAGLAETINSGAYLKTLIGGSPTALALTFDMANVASPVPQISYRIDHGQWTATPIAATVPLTLPSGNTWGRHLLEVVVKSTTETASRWNAPRNATVKLTGITITAPGSVTLAKPTARNLRLIVFGDSITEGVRTLNATATDDTDRNDARQGWAWQLAEAVGAEVGVVGFGATGLNAGGSGGVPALPTSYASLWSGKARTFTQQPDVVVINIGTNDSGDVTTAMTSLLNGLLSATTAHIVVLRPFNGAQAGNLQAGIAACSNPKRVRYVDTTGWWASADASDALHPYGYANVATIAPKVAEAVRSALARGATWINVGGTAKAASIVRR